MKKRDFIITLMLLSACTSLTGCTEVPDEVRNVQEHKESAQDAETQEIKKYDTLDNIFGSLDDSMDNLLNGQYENIMLEKKFSIAKPEKCGESVMRIGEDFNQKADELFREYVGEGYDDKYYSDGNKYTPPGPEYDDTAQRIHLGSADKGFFMYEYRDATMHLNCEQTDCIVLAGGYEDKTYKMKDGDYKLSEIIAKADQQARKWEQYQNGMQFEPYCVYVYTNEKTECNQFTINYQRTYENASVFHMLVEDQELRNKDFIPDYEFTAYVNSMDGPVSIINQYNAQMEMKDEYEEIITFDYAISQLNEILADYHVHEIKWAGIEYILSSEVEVEGEYFPAGSEYKATPHWVIYFSLDKDEETFATIDCKSGKLTFFLNGYIGGE